MPNQILPEQIFHALGDATRLAVISRLALGPTKVTDLARPFDMALPSFMRHLGIMESCGLISSNKIGRVRTCQLQTNALEQVKAWLTDRNALWALRLNQLSVEFSALETTSGDHQS